MVAITPGEVIPLSPLVRRITAPNPGPMTGPGTNSYLIGKEQIAVIDPGPAIPSHVDAILQACNGRLKWILVTHTHKDHSPAAAELAEATGALIMGNLLAEDDGFQDSSFKPYSGFDQDQCLQSDEFSLRAIKTPGHVDNHICFLLEQEGLLFSGDHIMQGSTVVIIPPHGDMKDYIESLQRLKSYSLQTLAPAHGELINQPQDEINGLIEHRLGREKKSAGCFFS